MKLLDVKAGMNPRSARIFLAEKESDIPRVAIDMKTGENRMPKPDYHPLVDIRNLDKLCDSDRPAFGGAACASCRAR